MSRAANVLQIVVLRDGILVSTEVFTPGSYTLGSGPKSDLVLQDSAVDAEHAVIYFQNGRAAIHDSGSRDGTYVNGRKVRVSEVKPADEVACGPFVLKARVVNPETTRRTTPVEITALLNGTMEPESGFESLSGENQIPESTGEIPLLEANASGILSLGDDETTRQMTVSVDMKKLLEQTRNLDIGGPAETTRPSIPVPAIAPVHAAALSQPPVPTVEVHPHAVAHPGLASHAPARRKAPAPVYAPAPEPVPAAVAKPAEHAPHSLHSRAAAALDRAVEKSNQFEAIRQKRAALPAPGQHVRSAMARAKKVSGRSRLYFELYWDGVRQKAGAYVPTRKKQTLRADLDDKADLPLWGFKLPEGGYDLAEAASRTAYHVFIPPDAQVETLQGNAFHAPPQGALKGHGHEQYLTLENGQALRLSYGEMALVAYVAPRPERVFVNPLKGIPWLLFVCYAILGTGFGYFLKNMPKQEALPANTAAKVPVVAVKLMVPQPKKKERAEKQLAAIKEKAAKVHKEKAPAGTAKDKTVAKSSPAPALKALEKLTMGGSASSKLFTAVDKISGDGSKRKTTGGGGLTALLGKGVASTGVPGLGLGTGKGGGTQGGELLRGMGGTGIGALGAGGVGKGTVGGTVTRATGRAIAAQGSIDRDAVAKVVNSHLGEVSACYEIALLKDPGLVGKVVLEWTISSSGSVTAARTKSSSLKSPSVESCILQKLKGWQFPPAQGGSVIISYPFQFNSVGY